MFDVTGDDIAQLSDAALRELVARLCKDDLRRKDLPVSAVTAGGHQDAPDGGIDVRVALPVDSPSTHFIRRSSTGFQVKKPDMRPANIQTEMRPNDTLRPAIYDLVSEAGAYIIVSSTASTTDTSLRNRVEAMKSAVSGVAGSANFHVDFFDRQRLADWVNLHPGTAIWVREKLGKALSGWHPYGNWSAPAESADAEYIRDSSNRLWDPQGNQLDIDAGLIQMRETLSCQPSVVRLVGLSGLGKTRFVQALFDCRIGDNALHPADVAYCDMGDNPCPSPQDLLRKLIASDHRMIVIVDNCLPDTHRTLANACTKSEGKISLITVEYDVGEDIPEHTDVYRLVESSTETITTLIKRRTPHISQIDRSQIAEFSGGNARIALALCQSIRRGDTISGLTDRQLFERLFYQRRGNDTKLLRAAEVLSLVYSFDGETTEGKTAELPLLADLAGMPADNLDRSISELTRRYLLQQRGRWRAVLPHALANKLARQALENIRRERIISLLVDNAPERLAKSFCRRLGYLHDSETAQRIVGDWYNKNGRFCDINSLSNSRMEMFRCVAPVVPEAALAVLERGIANGTSDIVTDPAHENRRAIISLLKSLAFDSALFEKSASLLSVLARENPDDGNAASDTFRSLFSLVLSGTHASVDKRVSLVVSLLKKDDNRAVECGLTALDDMLKTKHFSAFSKF